MKNREKQIIRTSMIGIGANLLLAAFKAVVGLLSNSIAIVLDAVNNLSDAASSVITIIGTSLAGREPDKKHPFGYGRIEYFSALIIAGLVLYAGLTSLTESVRRILHPETPSYTGVTLLIVAAGVAVKILLGRYVKKSGLELNSDSLVNSGQDAVMDAAISASTLAAAVIYMLKGIGLEAWLGAVISVLIIRSGIGMLKETVSELLGEKLDPKMAVEIKETVKSQPEILGAYDLILHNYGPDTYNGSVHIEVPDTMSMQELDGLTRRIQEDVHKKHGVILTGVGIYAVDTKDPEMIRIREDVRRIVLSHEHVQQMHGFYCDPAEKKMRFDAVISFNAEDRRKILKEVEEDVAAHYPGYELAIQMDANFAEE